MHPHFVVVIAVREHPFDEISQYRQLGQPDLARFHCVEDAPDALARDKIKGKEKRLVVSGENFPPAVWRERIGIKSALFIPVGVKRAGEAGSKIAVFLRAFPITEPRKLA